jgi:hypothetical protein
METKDITLVQKLEASIPHNYTMFKKSKIQSAKGQWIKYRHNRMKKTELEIYHDPNNAEVYAKIKFNPHYHMNDYRHNGNDMSAKNCINSIMAIMHEIGIVPHEYQSLKIINMEFATNLNPKANTAKMLDNIQAWRQKPIERERDEKTYMLRTGTGYKSLKIYYKGLQYGHFDEVDNNALRFEVKANMHKGCRAFGVFHVGNLLELETYQKMAKALETEARQLIFFDEKMELDGLKPKHQDFVKSCLNVEAWTAGRITDQKNRFYRLVGPYYTMKKDFEAMVTDKVRSLQNA